MIAELKPSIYQEPDKIGSFIGEMKGVVVLDKGSAKRVGDQLNSPPSSLGSTTIVNEVIVGEVHMGDGSAHIIAVGRSKEGISEAINKVYRTAGKIGDVQLVRVRPVCDQL